MSTVALVTGANSGIGSAIVTELLDRGLTVVATVRDDRAERRVRRLGEADDEGGDRADRLIVARLDVTDAAAAERVVARYRPDVLVNNAGHAELGGVMDVDDAAAAAQLDAMVVGPMRLARLVAAQLQDDGRPGRIVNLSSMLADVDLPFTGWYSAAKAALGAVGDALRLELRPSGIDVVRIECGAVRTDVWDDAADEVARDGDPTTERARRRWGRLTSIAQPLFAEPSTVATTVADAVTARRPRAVYRVGFASHLGPLSAFVPTAVEDSVTAGLFALGRRVRL